MVGCSSNYFHLNVKPTYYSLSLAITFQRRAAMAPPMNGPTMNTHNCERASPPWKRAGPMERAGLTEVPVKWIPTKWMRIRLRPMARPAKLLVAPFVFEVAPSTTSTKRAVSTISTIRPLVTPKAHPLAPVAVVMTGEVSPEATIPASTAAARMAPMTWKIMYIPQSLALILPLRNTPSVMAGLMWQPEMPPMV